MNKEKDLELPKWVQIINEIMGNGTPPVKKQEAIKNDQVG